MAAHFQAVGDAGGYSEHTMAAVKVVLKWDALELLLAHIPNLRMESWVVYTNSIPGGCMRAIGNIQLNLALGLAIDAWPSSWAWTPSTSPWPTWPTSGRHCPASACRPSCAKGRRGIGWDERHAPGAGPWVDVRRHLKRGLGFSCHNSWHAAWQEQIRGDVQVTVKLNPDMSVILQAPMVETGTGSNSCAVFACAESLAFLGVRPEDIHWIQRADTETGLKDMVQTDSSVLVPARRADAGGGGARGRQLLEMAAPVWTRPPESSTSPTAGCTSPPNPSAG